MTWQREAGGQGIDLFWFFCFKSTGFLWTWFTDAVGLGSWAHAGQPLRATTTLEPRWTKTSEAWEGVEDCSWVCPACSMASSVSVVPGSDCHRGVFCFGDTKGNVIVFTSDNVANGLFNLRIPPRTSKWGS